MKLKVKLENGKQYLIIKYSKRDWNKIKEKLENLGLEVAETTLGLGLGLRFKYYRDRENKFGSELVNFLRSSTVNNFINDINSYVIDDFGTVNLAILRIIPNENLEVKIPLHKWLTILDFNRIVKMLSKAYEFVFNLLREAEVEIKLPSD